MTHTEGEITGVTDVPVQFYRVDDTLFAVGSRQHWLAGADVETGARFDLIATAESETKYLILTLDFRDGTQVREYVNLGEMIDHRVEAIIAEYRSTRSSRPC